MMTSRRQFLTTSGAVALGGAVSACGVNGDGQSNTGHNDADETVSGESRKILLDRPEHPPRVNR